MVRLGSLLCLGFIMVEVALAQVLPTTQPKRPTPQSGSQEPSGGQRIRPRYLSGKVVYVDGTPADASAIVELLCDGRVLHQAHTLHGDFSLEVSGRSTRLKEIDASISAEDAFGPSNSYEAGFGSLSGQGQGAEAPANPSFSQVSLWGCELRASQSGFAPESIPLSVRGPMDNPDVGLMVLYRLGSITGTTTSVNTMSAPKKARKQYKKALNEVKNKEKANYKKAAGELEKAVKLYPEFAAAWELLGHVRLKLKDDEGARGAFESALASDPQYVRPYVAMMKLEYRQQRWDQVSHRSSQLIKLNPHHLTVHYYQGFASIKLGRTDQAEESLTKVRASHEADDYPYASYMLGVLLAGKKDFEGAARELRHYLKISPEAPQGDHIKAYLSGLEQKGLMKVASVH